MYFFLSKTLGTLLLPTNLAFFAGAIGLVLMVIRKGKLGSRLLIGSFLVLLVTAVSPLGYALLLPLENRFPARSGSGRPPQGIIVLGGGLRTDVSASRGVPVAGFGIDRIIYAAKLARDFPQAKIIYSGGSSNLYDNDAREADYASQVLESLNVSKDRIVIDRLARNTLENANFVRSLVGAQSDQRWLLVTSAYHMPRAVGLFRKAGLAVDPVPVGWLTGDASDLFRFTTGFEGIFRVNIAAREWIGLLAARLTGQTSEILPSLR